MRAADRSIFEESCRADEASLQCSWSSWPGRRPPLRQLLQTDPTTKKIRQIHTHTVGISLLCGEWEKACRQLLAPRSGEQDEVNTTSTPQLHACMHEGLLARLLMDIYAGMPSVHPSVHVLHVTLAIWKCGVRSAFMDAGGRAMWMALGVWFEKPVASVLGPGGARRVRARRQSGRRAQQVPQVDERAKPLCARAHSHACVCVCVMCVCMRARARPGVCGCNSHTCRRMRRGSPCTACTWPADGQPHGV